MAKDEFHNVAELPLEDAPDIRETFVSVIGSVGVLHENVAVELGTLRVALDEKGSVQPHAKLVGRLILTLPAAGELLRQLSKLSASLKAQQAAAGEKKH